MDKKNAMKWITTLRSGKYAQGYGALQTETGFCCLGVACDIFIPNTRKRKFITTSGHWILIGGMPTEQPNSPFWLNKVDKDFYDKTGTALSDLNDRERRSFDEIADLIQAVYVERVLE